MPVNMRANWAHCQLERSPVVVGEAASWAKALVANPALIKAAAKIAAVSRFGISSSP
jgi:hypothetical protein